MEMELLDVNQNLEEDKESLAHDRIPTSCEESSRISLANSSPSTVHDYSRIAQENLWDVSHILVHKLHSRDLVRFQKNLQFQENVPFPKRGYLLTTPSDDPVYLAFEHKTRQHCLGQQRPFLISFYNAIHGDLSMKIERGLSSNLAHDAMASQDAIYTDYFNRTNVSYADGSMLGQVWEKWLCCTPFFHVYEESTFSPSLLIKGPTGSKYSSNRMPDFIVYLAQENFLPVGKIGRIHKSVIRRPFGRSCFSVEFPAELRPNLKMLLIGGALQLSITYFEGKWSGYDCFAFGLPLAMLLITLPILVVIIILST